jgi:hypothetical protein
MVGWWNGGCSGVLGWGTGRLGIAVRERGLLFGAFWILCMYFMYMHVFYVLYIMHVWMWIILKASNFSTTELHERKWLTLLNSSMVLAQVLSLLGSQHSFYTRRVWDGKNILGLFLSQLTNGVGTGVVALRWQLMDPKLLSWYKKE